MLHHLDLIDAALGKADGRAATQQRQKSALFLFFRVALLA